MKHLESYIARYLDGEMSPSEAERFSRRLAGSSDMQVRLREMIALRRAARRMPVLHAPSTRLESTLFVRLRQEGLYAEAPPLGADAPPVGRRSVANEEGRNGRRRRGVALVAPLLLLVCVLGGYFVVRDGVVFVTEGAPNHSLALSTQPIPSLDLDSGMRDHLLVDPVDGLPAQPRRGDVRNSAVRRSSTYAPREINNSNESTVIEGSLPYAVDLKIPSQLNSLNPMALPSRSFDASAYIASQTSTPIPQVLLDYPRQKRGESSAMVASLNGGMGELSSGDGIAMRDVQVRVGLEFNAGDRLTVIVGSSANVIETRHENMGPVSRPPGGNGATKQLLAQPPSPHRIDVNDDAWLGIGYQRPIAEFGGVRLDIGASVGSSSSTLRLGGDISLRRKLTKSIAFELSGTASQMIPYDRHVEQFTLFGSPDGYVYSGASQRATFYSYGVQAGVTVNLSH